MDIDEKSKKIADNSFTIKCKYVYKRKDGTWSCCKKMDQCKFAHSLQQLQFLKCNQDLNCTVFNNGGFCMYKHSNETREDWIQRTKLFRPELPEKTITSYNSIDKITINIPKIKPNTSEPVTLKFIESLNQFICQKIK